MKAPVSTAGCLGLLLLVGCAHPEDRRWAAASLPIADLSSEDGGPTIRVYSIPTVTPSAGKTRLRDLSEAGQAAFIEAMAKAKDGAARDALRAALAVPLEGASGGESALDRTELQRTLIVTVNKGWNALPGDRLMRTVVTIRPHVERGQSAPFEFTGYTVAATDHQTQDIAQLETESQASLSATLAPKVGGFGDNSLQATASRRHKTNADIGQEYEKLNVDILPGALVITRESERGQDVFGNTFVEVTLSPVDPLSQPKAFLAASMKLDEGGKALSPAKASLEIKPLAYLPACPLLVDADMKYMVRHVDGGREYYTEGKQIVAITRGAVPPATYPLVRPREAQAPLFQIVGTRGREHPALFAWPVDGSHKPLLFDSFEDARRLAYWLEHGGAGRVGNSGVELRLGSTPLPRGGHYSAILYRHQCE